MLEIVQVDNHVRGMLFFIIFQQKSNLIHPFKSLEVVLSTFLTFVDAAFDWSSENPIRDAVCVALDSAVDFALSKLHASMDKSSERLSLDALCRDIISRCPLAKRASEVLLLRLEDVDCVGGILIYIINNFS